MQISEDTKQTILSIIDNLHELIYKISNEIEVSSMDNNEWENIEKKITKLSLSLINLEEEVRFL